MLSTLPTRMELDHDENQSLLSIIHTMIFPIVNYALGEEDLPKGQRLVCKRSYDQSSVAKQLRREHLYPDKSSPRNGLLT